MQDDEVTTTVDFNSSAAAHQPFQQARSEIRSTYYSKALPGDPPAYAESTTPIALQKRVEHTESKLSVNETRFM